MIPTIFEVKDKDMVDFRKSLMVAAPLALCILLPELADAQEFDTYEIRSATCQLMDLMQGTVGAMLTAVAGIGAIVGAAFGAYRAAFSLITVSTAAFIMPALVSLWFGFSDANCIRGAVNGGGSGGQQQQQAEELEPIFEDDPVFDEDE